MFTCRLRDHYKRIKIKTDQMLASATRVGVKLRVKTNKKEENSGNEEEATGVLPGGQHRTKHSETAVPSTGTTILSLKDMVAAPDDRQSWPPTLSQLREPVLDLVEK